MAPVPPPLPNPGGIQGQIEARRAYLSRVNDFLIKPNRLSGFYEIEFVGTANEQEVAVDVEFPIWFVDRPSFTFGGELVRDILVDGSFPTISAVVVGWTKTHDVRPGGGYYIGARIAVVASGREGEQMILHWVMDGKAIHLVGAEGDADA